METRSTYQRTELSILRQRASRSLSAVADRKRDYEKALERSKRLHAELVQLEAKEATKDAA